MARAQAAIRRLGLEPKGEPIRGGTDGAHLTALGLPTAVPDVDLEEAIRVMGRDKKVEHGKLRFVLPTKMGHVELVGGVPADDVRAAMAD